MVGGLSGWGGAHPVDSRHAEAVGGERLQVVHGERGLVVRRQDRPVSPLTSLALTENKPDNRTQSGSAGLHTLTPC